MHRLWAIAAAGGLAGTATSAAGQAPAPAKPPAKWTLDVLAPYCSVSIGNPDELGLSLWTIPGSDTAELYLMGKSPQLASVKDPTTKVTINPGAAVFDAAIYPEKASGRDVAKLTFSDWGFAEAFGRGREIQVATPKGPVTVATPGANKASAALRNCGDQMLKEWGHRPCRTSVAAGTSETQAWADRDAR